MLTFSFDCIDAFLQLLEGSLFVPRKNLFLDARESGKILNNPASFLTTESNKNIKYLLAILNSNLINWYILQSCTALGKSGIRIYNDDIFKFPIPQINDDNRQIANEIEDLVDKIIESKKKLREMSKNALASPDDIKLQEKTISVLDKLINNKVYSLYFLTPDEISLIESSI